MKREYVILVGGISGIVLIFSGFISWKVSDEKKELALREGRGSMSEQGFLENEEYVVDASDYVVAHPLVSTLPEEEISSEERMSLLDMRQEEKLARDVYRTLYDAWGIQIFRNIAQSEQTHTDSVRYLLERYAIEDPIRDDTIGVYGEEKWATLYEQLVEQGMRSQEEALMVGITIEDLDIADIRKSLSFIDNQDIIAVYENLERGSRNHMRAFSRQLDRYGKVYEAQYLTQSEVEEILEGSQERGNESDSNRQNNGRGGNLGGGNGR